MTPNYIELLDMATELGVWVDEDDVGWLGVAKGGWFPEYELILLRPGMGAVARRCTLAHEIGHATLGHAGDVSGWFGARQERQADEYAVGLLIDPVEYRLAEELCGGHAGAIAAELGVTRRLVGVFQTMVQRGKKG